jgi:hypothetical protein
VLCINLDLLQGVITEGQVEHHNMAEQTDSTSEASGLYDGSTRVRTSAGTRNVPPEGCGGWPESLQANALK